MARVKNTKVTRARRKKVLKRAKGFFGSKHRLYRTAHEQVMRAMRYEFRDRKQRKRQFRKLWITRINAGCALNEIKYSKFIHGLILANVVINRKVLSDLAVNDPKAFTQLCEVAKKALKSGKQVESKNVDVVNEIKEFELIDVKNLQKTPSTTTKVVKKAVKKEEKVEKVDLNKLTVAELKDLAKEKNVTIPAGSKKADIVKLLS